jgi:hypothetical protein
MARLLLGRLVGPITLTDPADYSTFLEWKASVTPALLVGLVHDGTSPTGTDAGQCLAFRGVSGLVAA